MSLSNCSRGMWKLACWAVNHNVGPDLLRRSLEEGCAETLHVEQPELGAWGSQTWLQCGVYGN
jgi:hypothetical protein